MSVAITELMTTCRPDTGMPCGLTWDVACTTYGQILLEKGFYFLLVANGTASVSDAHAGYVLAPLHLLVVTPSIRVTLADMSADFRMVCLYIEPDYFDTLSVGQLVYGQVSQFVGNYLLPIFQLETEQADYLQKTLALFPVGWRKCISIAMVLYAICAAFSCCRWPMPCIRRTVRRPVLPTVRLRFSVTSSACWFIIIVSSTISVFMLTVCTFPPPIFRASCAILRGIPSVSTYPNCSVPMHASCWNVPTRM